MHTTDTVLLIILTSLLSILLIVSIAVAVAVFKLISAIKQVAVKAENVIDSVESAAEVLKDTGGRLAILKLVRNIIKLSQRSRK
jgi:hypothetical protein